MENLKLLRCMKLVQLIQSGFRINAQELAHKFGVCKRTIFRDFRTLEQAGIFICYNRETGTHEIEGGIRLRLWSFQEEELILLVAALCTSELLAHPPARECLQSVIAKLLSQSPANLRGHLANVANSCRQESSKTIKTEIDEGVFKKILDALGQRKYIRLCLASLSCPSENVQTKVAPYFFIASSTTWYLIGQSSWHRHVLRFDIQEIRHAEITDDHYEIPQHYHHMIHLPHKWTHQNSPLLIRSDRNRRAAKNATATGTKPNKEGSGTF
jgi:predicted DNA-binding transcriptional regulator YafY